MSIMKKSLYLVVLLLVLTMATGLASPLDTTSTKTISEHKITIAIMPIFDNSLYNKTPEQVIEPLKKHLDAKFPSERYVLLKDDAVTQAVKNTTIENEGFPVVAELSMFGKELNADYVLFFHIDPIKGEGHRSMFSGKLKVDLSIRTKVVDVQTGRYVINKTFTGNGMHKATTMGALGGPSVKKPINAALNMLLAAFDKEVHI